MYSNLQWLDHAVTPDRTFTLKENADGTVTLTPAGTIIQQGTNMSAANFNNIEMGITDHDLAMEILVLLARNLADRATKSESDIANTDTLLLAEVTPEIKTLTLSNTAKYPFNSSIANVSMSQSRNSLNYTVEAVATASDGNVGEIVISDKQKNGFKIAFTGSATSVTVSIKIRGGILV